MKHFSMKPSSNSLVSIVVVLLSTLCVEFCYAQTLPSFLRVEENKQELLEQSDYCSHLASSLIVSQIPPSQIVRRNYDVLKYTLFMDWRKPLTLQGEEARAYNGMNSIQLRIDSNSTTSIELDARELKIDSVFVDGALLFGVILQTGDKARIQLPRTYNKDEIVSVDVYYTQKSTKNPGGWSGFVNVPSGQFGSNPLDTVFENLAYTMSEPTSARAWMPCNDRPYDKARASITVLVPRGYKVSSNGILDVHRRDLGDDKHESFTWNDTTPIPTYLMVVCASRFSQFDGIPYRRVTDTNQLIAAPVFLWPRDSLNYAANLSWMQESTVRMMEAYSHMYGEYPFSKYAQTLLYPFFLGSMEHQTNTTHHRLCLVNRWENVIAHELMHHWTGNRVTCAAWNDIWLNEGGATFGEYLWIERTQGVEAARKSFMKRRDESYFAKDSAASQPAIYAVTLNNLFNNGTTYVKAGWVYYMLRSLVGDSTYFDVMKKYFNRFAYQSIETEDMISFLESQIPNPRVPFRTFFDQWIYKPGHPYYSAELQSISPLDDDYLVKLEFRQRSPIANAPEKYVMPVTLRFHHAYSKATFDYTFLNDSLTQNIQVRVPFLPRTFVIDEDETILCMKDISTITVRVEDNDQTDAMLNDGMFLYPNPVHQNDRLQLRYQVGSQSEVTLGLYDVTGRLVQQLQHGEFIPGQYQTEISTNSLSPGSYSLHLAVGEKFYFSTFTVAP